MVKLVQTTLGAGATPLSSTTLNCRQLYIQGGSDDSYIGDSTVTTGTGIKLPHGSVSGVLGGMSATVLDLKQIYVVGTAGDTVNSLIVI